MTVRWVANPFHSPAAAFGEDQSSSFDPAEAEAARALLKSWPIYAPTPLVDCPGVARELGLGRVWVKDEGLRAPLHSFKSLGGAFALGEHLRRHISERSGRAPDYAALFAGEYKAVAEDFCAVSATDGNHGRSLAWGARLFGTRCRIYLPANVSPARAEAIAAFGAECVRIEGNYDAAVARAKADAEHHGWTFLQDTSFPGYHETHRLIMHGYSLFVQEIVEQLGDKRPTHAFVQVGCGGMAATITGHLWSTWGRDLPRMVLVQSEMADALVRSFEAGRRLTVGGDHATLMIGIACGEIAELAWPLFEPTAFAAMAIDDASAVDAMRMAVDKEIMSPRMLMGETGAAGLAALVTCARDANFRTAAGLDKNSSVLLINSEGETDPDTYAVLAGVTAAEMRGHA